jgi:hypothetical protein
MNKPTLQAVDLESSTDIPVSNPFDPANLRLDQSYTETVGVKKLITTIPVRKPNKQVFFRIHPGEEWRDNFPMGGTAGVSMIIILFAMITFMAALFAQETRGKTLVD